MSMDNELQCALELIRKEVSISTHLWKWEESKRGDYVLTECPAQDIPRQYLASSEQIQIAKRHKEGDGGPIGLRPRRLPATAKK